LECPGSASVLVIAANPVTNADTTRHGAVTRKIRSPSVWERCNGLFAPVDDFDSQELNSQIDKRHMVTEIDLINQEDECEVTSRAGGNDGRSTIF
jgi:hypothetical protein